LKVNSKEEDIMKKKPKGKVPEINKDTVNPEPINEGKADGGIGHEDTVDMLKALLAGRDPICTTEAERKTKASLLRDIEKAKKKGWQLDIPS